MFIQCLCCSVSTTTCLGYWNIGCYHIWLILTRASKHTACFRKSKTLAKRLQIKDTGSIVGYGFCSRSFPPCWEPWRRAWQPWLSYFGFHFVPCWAAFYQRFKLATNVHVRGQCKAKRRANATVYFVATRLASSRSRVRSEKTRHVSRSVWLFNFLHAKWGGRAREERRKKRGSGNSAHSRPISKQLKRRGDTFSVCCWAFALVLNSPRMNQTTPFAQNFSLIVWPLCASRYCSSLSRDNSDYFANSTTGG